MLTMFKFTVDNLRSKETTSFIGDGETMTDAFKDGMANLQRADASGLSVTKGEKIVTKTPAQFERALDEEF